MGWRELNPKCGELGSEDVKEIQAVTVDYSKTWLGRKGGQRRCRNDKIGKCQSKTAEIGVVRRRG